MDLNDPHSKEIQVEDEDSHHSDCSTSDAREIEESFHQSDLSDVQSEEAFEGKHIPEGSNGKPGKHSDNSHSDTSSTENTSEATIESVEDLDYSGYPDFEFRTEFEDGVIGRIQEYVQETSVNEEFFQGTTLLHVVVESKKPQTFMFLLEHPDIDINRQNEFGETPLMTSIRFAPEWFTEKLISAAADTNIPNRANQTALHLAIKKNNVHIAKLLIKNGADLNVRTSVTLKSPIHEAVCCLDGWENQEMLCMLLYYGADATAVNSEGCSPFMESLINSSFYFQYKLINYETDFNRTTKEGIPLLMLSVWHGSPLVSQIIDNGADVNTIYNDTNMLNQILRLHNVDLFEKVLNAYDYNVSVECNSPFLRYLHNISTTFTVFEGYIDVLFASKKLSEIIDHEIEFGGQYPEDEYSETTFLIQHFAMLADLCVGQYQFTEDKFLSLVYISLSHGIELYLSDVDSLFLYFGYSKIVDCLLYHNVIMDEPEAIPSVPYLIFNVEVELKHYMNNFQFPPYKPICGFSAQSINTLLDICTPSQIFKCRFEMYIETIMNGNPGKKFKEVRRRLAKLNVPSLHELSRNAVRRVIYNHYNARKSHIFYSVLRKMPLPQAIKNIIALKIPVN